MIVLRKKLAESPNPKLVKGKKPVLAGLWLKLAPRNGFEPLFTASKAAVLPLDDQGALGRQNQFTTPDYHSEYFVPSKLIFSDELLKSKIPGSAWLTDAAASSIIIFHDVLFPTIGSIGT